MGEETLTRGTVAKQAGVHIETLRYYERRGLLKEPPRRPSGYREYPTEVVRVVRFIKRAQELGFTLEEVAALLELRATTDAECRDVCAIAEGKLRVIDAKIGDLRAMRQRLAALMRSCSLGRPVVQCPIIESFERENGSVPGVKRAHSGRTAAGINTFPKKRGKRSK